MRTTAILLLAAATACAGEWTAPVEVQHEHKRSVAYRARLDGPYLIVEATHVAPWHTYAMDNKQRADVKLARRQSLGIDQPTAIKVSGGLELAGPWYQPEPIDLSKPEIRWYTFGFENTIRFAAKVKRAGSGPAQINIRGQACTASNCKNIDLDLALPVTAEGPAPKDLDLKSMVEVRPGS